MRVIAAGHGCQLLSVNVITPAIPRRGFGAFWYPFALVFRINHKCASIMLIASRSGTTVFLLVSLYVSPLYVTAGIGLTRFILATSFPDILEKWAGYALPAGGGVSQVNIPSKPNIVSLTSQTLPLLPCIDASRSYIVPVLSSR